MKKLLLLLLACGIHAVTFAQIEVSDKTIINPEKWTITPNKLKASTGRLLIANPAGSIWTIYVYRMADNKYVTSFNNTNNKGVIALAPGEYKITLNLAPVENVLIKKGHDTKLKTGVLDIPHNEVWYLYDETGGIYVTSGNKPEKLALPIGKYTLKIDGADQQVAVGDGARDQEVANSGIEDNKYWVIKPLEGMSADLGKLSIYIPKDTTIYFPALDKWITMPYLIRDTVKIRFSGSSTTYTNVELPKYLSTKTYEIKLNGFRLTVPVKSGKETRIKAGFLVITKKESDGGGFDGYVWDQLFGSDDITWEWDLIHGQYPSEVTGQYYDNIIASGKKGRIYALPPGEYKLRKNNPDYYKDDIIYKVIIKDGEWVTNGVKQ